MNILQLTNTYTPHVGGVARSVEQFADAFRRLGHNALVVAPYFEGASDSPHVVHVPAIPNFNGTSFSLPLPLPGYLYAAVDDFRPDIVHSNHPFLLGDTALRIAASRDLPIVFTYHTLYQKYTHYVIGDSQTLKRFVTDLASGYCNLCDAVVAPSETIREMLLLNGVEREINVIPTGVVVERFLEGDGAAVREAYGVPKDAYVVGHVGRLAPEKNLSFLADAVSQFVAASEKTWFLVAGAGSSEEEILRTFDHRGVSGRLVMLGELGGDRLSDAYHAMDVFAFSSLSETQGMVLTEAMAAGVPVVALDGPGVRETLLDGQNGLLLPSADREQFVTALRRMRSLSVAEANEFQAASRRQAKRFSMEPSAKRAIALYESLLANDARQHHHDAWSIAGRRVAQEWRLWDNMLEAAGDAVLHSSYAAV